MKITDLPEALFADAISLWHELGLTRPWNDPEADLVRALSGPSSTVLAACDDNAQLLGTAMVGHDGHRGWVYYLAVRPGEQGKGFGRDLMTACQDWVRDRGMPKIQLMVRRANHDAISFYEAIGYEDGDVIVLGRFITSPSPERPNNDAAAEERH